MPVRGRVHTGRIPWSRSRRLVPLAIMTERRLSRGHVSPASSLLEREAAADERKDVDRLDAGTHPDFR